MACLRLYPKIWLQELCPCLGHETQILPSAPRRVIEVTLTHGCMDVKRTFLPYGKNLWVYENRVWKKIPPERGTEYGERRIIQLLVMCI